MAKECPHCFRTVLALANGNCPNCRRDMSKPPAYADGWGGLWVTPTAKLPAVCCTCAADTESLVEVVSTLNYTSGAEVRGVTDASADKKMLGFYIALVSPVTFLIFALFGMFRGGDTSGASVCVKLKMRQCKPCRRNGTLEPQTVDYDYHKMRFVVTRKFLEAYQAGNGEA